ncbi:MAG: ATP-grasp domain-containing protein [Gammaproteobacteria bacterium]|nr:ATP-grasp domain-containing protein [Gammaproteobacteria bacterium]MBI5618600.1 ATP-grasp domain-containing protein [Gammaproteobacteria bacterium]
MLKKILIANRGEIACRIMRTAQRLGIGTVAVHHFADRAAPHVALADEARELHAEVPTAAYLDAEQLIAAAQATGAEGIHPGYGFLSENAGFAAKVEAAGLVFIGPQPGVIELMGDKIRSREFAQAHGVPVAPSIEQEGDLAAFVAGAEAIGFPLLIKAAAGGGGKGMSIVRNAQELAARATIASSEAQRYFADGRIYAERYVERPRHIEVQVLGDGTGTVLHLFERECSIQRRFQKIVEESPAARLAPELREKICSAAVKLASSAKYRNAGTVEFILAPNGEFYFLEMNTRLQVEHPVTEYVTGLDLVEAQLRVAAGETLWLEQADVKLTGHAIECRICAEQPEHDFRPATGTVRKLRIPTGEGVRFDGGIREGQAITAAFDSMLAKLVVHGADRHAATDMIRDALEEFVLLGVDNNSDYLGRIFDHEAFRAGDLHTGFVVEHAAGLAPPPLDATDEAAVLLAAALATEELRRLIDEVPEPHASIGGWRN